MTGQTGKLSLDSCTPKKCKRCDMVYILKDFVKPIMQLLTNDIKEYNMRLLVTKCLNVAITVSYFMLGRKGIEMADQCDTRVVIKRHEAGEENNHDITNALKKDILNKRCKQRYLYYILMTDGNFPYKDTQRQAVYFPGHVLLLEKIPNGDSDPFFNVYQAYINAYDLKGHVERNGNSVKMSYKQVSDLITKIGYILSAKEWDAECIQYWKDFTFVDTTSMKGSLSRNKFYLCYRKSKVTDCIDTLKKYATIKLKEVSAKNVDKNAIYGDIHAYDANQQPLSNSEIETSLQKLLQRLQEKR